MKLEELISEYELCVKADAALVNVDWNYDVADVDGRRYAKGQKAMTEAQVALKSLYRVFPEVANELWQKHCPYSKPGVLPTWVLR